MKHFHLTLRQKIYFGYLMIGLIALSFAAVAYLTFDFTISRFNEFASSSRQAQVELSFSQQITELQRHALIYTYEGHPTAASRVLDDYQLLSQQLSGDHGQQSYNGKLARIHTHLQTYIEAFKKVIIQRQRQRDIVDHELPASANHAEQSLRQYIKTLQQPGKTGQLIGAHQMRAELLQIENHAMQYFDTLDQQYIHNVKQGISQLMQTVQQLQHNRTAPQLTRLIGHLQQYQSTFLEAVQRTRGYLFLVNVVMAAEAYEIIYQSNRLADSLNQQMYDIESEIPALLNQVTTIILTTGLLFFGCLIIFSYFFGRNLSLPLLALTDTFRKLAQGSAHAAIPHYPKRDEIGQLSEAAAIFRDKNRQTLQLLEASEALSQDLKQKTQELERSNDELEQFVYTVSHDLKSPLVTSMGFIGIIQKLASQGKYEQAISKLDRVISANQRMGQLINDLLELSRVGRMDLEREAVDLNQLLTHFIDINELRLQQHGFTMAIDTPLPTIYANESRILQVFENLLSNALKYAVNPSGSQIHIGSRSSDEGHQIYFADNGPGIPPPYHHKVFGLFYRLNPDQEGTGIGLAVAAKVMKFHGGKIEIETSPREGACFWMTFPQYTQGEENE